MHSQDPRAAPNRRIATMAYAEQLGSYLQAGGNQGETTTW